MTHIDMHIIYITHVCLCIYIYRSMRHYDDLSRPHDPDVIQQRPYLSWVGDFWQLTCVCVCVYIYMYMFQNTDI